MPIDKIFKDDASEEKGERARMASFIGAMAVADLVKSTLGPKGMDKILQSTGRGHSVTVTKTLGAEVECCICKENLVIGDKMQELPCKHTFHPPCLKPWLDENNSCPICRHELPTDDQKYESWKEREKEAEEERKGAENAVRGGEYMRERDHEDNEEEED
ncbi:E3 ubiquitin-protein ligase AIP2-like isoform X2 [Brassica napus]|uniref:E3 ubiquitin-protein ligase AIP2-like isoform X2 n=1 Tax=Brassica napus TaxID=3708 RepID=UPI0020785AB5|nr:E3 ubiquitin-protein ligase AIP2-like isoform X2 [Brassica napus]